MSQLLRTGSAIFSGGAFLINVSTQQQSFFLVFFRVILCITGARKAVSITQPSMGGDLSSMGLTNHSYQSYVSSKVQPANTQHLSVISAPAPVLQRPDLPPSRKLASLENALRGARHPTRRTVKLKTLESGPNALVYS